MVYPALLPLMAHTSAASSRLNWRPPADLNGLANGVGSQYSSHYLGTWCIQHYYRWCRTPRLPVVDWTDATAGRFKWTRPFRRKTKSCFCACAITFQLASTTLWRVSDSDLQPLRLADCIAERRYCQHYINRQFRQSYEVGTTVRAQKAPHGCTVILIGRLIRNFFSLSRFSSLFYWERKMWINSKCIFVTFQLLPSPTLPLVTSQARNKNVFLLEEW